MRIHPDQIKQSLLQRYEQSDDIESQVFKSDAVKAEVIYFPSVCDSEKIDELIAKAFFQAKSKEEYQEYLLSNIYVQTYKNLEKAIQDMLRGTAVLFLEEDIYLVDVSRGVDVGIEEATVETTILGPQHALSEDVNTSLTIIRGRYQSPTLMVEKSVVGTLSQTKVFTVYDAQFVNQEALHKIKQLLTEMKVDVLQGTGQLQNLFRKRKKALFPIMLDTQRADRVAFNLAQGKVIILIDGTAFVLIAPCVFYDFFATMDDVYQSFWVSRFLLALRYLGLIISLILPAMYVSVTSYNPELFRVQLALSIAGSRAAVPYPSYLEVLFMLIMMELITESSIRLPKAIGPTATTVGGLILGQAASQAGLVSNIMIIVVAAVALANFVIPISSMGFTIRVLKYFILMMGTLFGLIGIVVGFIFILYYLADVRSFGIPYLKFFTQDSSREAVPAHGDKMNFFQNGRRR